LTSSLSEYGLYSSFHNGCPCADRADPDRDTVDAVGLVPRRLPFTQVNDDIRHFCHAISLDEHRVWVDFFLHLKMSSLSSLVVSSLVYGTAHMVAKAYRNMRCLAVNLTTTGPVRDGSNTSNGSIQSPKVEEVWFAGCHCGALYLMILYRYISHKSNVCRYRWWFSRQRNP
jgi:Uncharacterized alpha/beta hydrolase domain (DUF2235)